MFIEVVNMPSALENLPKPDPLWEVGIVGLRTLPRVNLPYYARTPKEQPFATIWLPTNASKVMVKDKQQDTMHKFYSRVLDLKNRKPISKDNFPHCFPLKLSNVPQEDKTKYEKIYRLPPRKWPMMHESGKNAMWKSDNNSLKPFDSLGRPKCGYYFSYAADNKRRLIGIMPSNVVAWRSKETHSH